MKSAWGISASDLVFVEHNELHVRLENDGFLDAKDHIVIPFHKCQHRCLDTKMFEIKKKKIKSYSLRKKKFSTRIKRNYLKIKTIIKLNYRDLLDGSSH